MVTKFRPAGTGASGVRRSNATKRAEGRRGIPRELALDLLQLALDIAGIADPSPATDATNALISLVRGNWFDTAISGASVIPYVGDLAKLGRLRKQSESVRKVMRMIDENPLIAEQLLPAFRRLKFALDWLPDRGNLYLKDIKTQVARFLLKQDGVLRSAHSLPNVTFQFEFKRFRERNRIVY